MTPKEKAQELVCKMKAHQKPSLRVSTMEININDTMPNAKQCALIAVDEIMQFLTQASKYLAFPEQIIYWQKVKNEIEQL